jgi:hypothetical protein
MNSFSWRHLCDPLRTECPEILQTPFAPLADIVVLMKEQMHRSQHFVKEVEKFAIVPMSAAHDNRRIPGDFQWMVMHDLGHLLSFFLQGKLERARLRRVDFNHHPTTKKGFERALTNEIDAFFFGTAFIEHRYKVDWSKPLDVKEIAGLRYGRPVLGFHYEQFVSAARKAGFELDIQAIEDKRLAYLRTIDVEKAATEAAVAMTAYLAAKAE